MVMASKGEKGLDFGDWLIIAYHWRGRRSLRVQFLFAVGKFSWVT